MDGATGLARRDAVVREGGGGPVSDFCLALQRLQKESGIDRTALARELAISRSQLHAILAGHIKRPPEWDGLVAPLVRACTDGDRQAVSEWRRRHAVLVEVHDELSRRTRSAETSHLPEPAMTVPAQLPADVPAFGGRSAELAELDSLLPAVGRQAAQEHSSKAVVISAVSGTAGVGKTALAVHWAHTVRQHFPDGQLYVNLRGFDPGGSVMEPAEAVRGFLDALNVPAPRIPVGLDAQAGLYRSLLAGRRMLVVLDNARDAAHVRPLLPGTESCLVVITSRNQLTGLVAAAGAHPLALDVLTPGESTELLASRLGARRVAAEPRSVEDIVTRCAQLPLALAIVAARAAIRPRFSLESFASELERADARLTALASGGDPLGDVRAVFSWSYRALTDDAARLFRMLSQHPGPGFGVPAAASLVGLPVDDARSLLDELTRTGLLTEYTPGRYGFHDLLQTYAAEQARRHDNVDDLQAAENRLLDFYAFTSYRADREIDPPRDLCDLAPLTSVEPTRRPMDARQALAWFTTEHLVLLALLDRAAARDLDAYVCWLAWSAATFLRNAAHFRYLAATQRLALHAARRLGDPAAEARALRALAVALSSLGDHDGAVRHLREALALQSRNVNPVGHAQSHRTFADVLSKRDRAEDALSHAEYALEIFRSVGHQGGHADTLTLIGWCHSRLGDHRQAVDDCRQAIELLRDIRRPHGIADSLDNLGHALRHLGDHEQAIDCHQQAVALYRNVGDPLGEATTLEHLGDVYEASGRLEQANETRIRAAVVRRGLEHSEV